jgi:hypothetical protein
MVRRVTGKALNVHAPAPVTSLTGIADAHAFYRDALVRLDQADVPFLVGGAYAFERYTGISRFTKDFDIFIRPQDAERALGVLASAGYRIEMTAPHWIAKAFHRDLLLDLIFSSKNGLAEVDDLWFDNAVDVDVLGIPARLCPAEEMIWQKAYVLDRGRYDGADVAHILRACADRLDWERLLSRFGSHWRLLLSHLVLFGFIYPSERARVPERVMRTLLERLAAELASAASHRVCLGTLLSHEQFGIDVDEWGYADARLLPPSSLSSEDLTR